MEKELQKLIEQLEQAKKNTIICLNNADCLVDMHGLEYWAGEVERLRAKIKELL